MCSLLILLTVVTGAAGLNAKYTYDFTDDTPGMKGAGTLDLTAHFGKTVFFQAHPHQSWAFTLACYGFSNPGFPSKVQAVFTDSSGDNYYGPESKGCSTFEMSSHRTFTCCLAPSPPGPAGLTPLAPANLPAEYLRGADGRMPHIHMKKVQHTCSYPNDAWSCADVSQTRPSPQSCFPDRMHGECMMTKLGFADGRNGEGMWHVVPPPTAGHNVPICGKCMKSSDGGEFPGWTEPYWKGAKSSTVFCSKEPVNGKWLMMGVIYSDDSCQTINSVQPLHLEQAVAPGEMPTECYQFKGCSPTPPKATCTQMDWKVICPDPSKGEQACNSHEMCRWWSGHESSLGYQFWHTLEKPQTNVTLLV